ncbi:OmpA family protein [uncultured Friedmanniella sp.]|uniref:OmpA family protein n=1 Tax=uncultured Friedmanniella sp. TaxID=335381 RepID=UPI0035CBDBD7
MSRSSDRRSARPYVLGLGLLLVGGLLGPGSASAAPGPVAPVVNVTAPVADVVAPVLDISFGESDLKREARVERLPSKTTITLDSTVLFGLDSAKINAKARDRLREVGQQLAGQGAGSVRITGYTDDLGSAAHGKTLSRQRATAVARLLRSDLPAADFAFTVVGRGEADPAVPNTSEKNRKVNRRVVVVYSKK